MTKKSLYDPESGEYIPRKQLTLSKYTDEMPEKLLELMSDGLSEARICKRLGISVTTLKAWINKHKDFKTAYEIGQAQKEAWWEEMGIAGMTGQIDKFNATVFLGFMNRQYDWNKKNDGKTEINIGTLNQLNNLTNAELQQKIESKMKKLKLLTATDEEK